MYVPENQNSVSGCSIPEVCRDEKKVVKCVFDLFSRFGAFPWIQITYCLERGLGLQVGFRAATAGRLHAGFRG